MWWFVAIAWADECACLAWEDEFLWSDCDPADEDCACDCTDEVPHGAGTTTSVSDFVCTSEGTVGPARPGSACTLDGSTCVTSDCCDDLVADCPEESEEGCGCASSGGPLGWLAVGAGLLVAGTRRACRADR